MKVLTAVVLVALVVYVSGEPCTDDQSCVDHGTTHCGGATHVACERVSLTEHQCHCTDGGAGGQSCSGFFDLGNCQCNGGRAFCVRGTCHCFSG